jgi:hypothetical protein
VGTPQPGKRVAFFEKGRELFIVKPRESPGTPELGLKNTVGELDMIGAK